MPQPAEQERLFGVEGSLASQILPQKEFPLIHFGTSTWAYPGWAGIVYSKVHRTSTDYLREYVRDDRFQTVGADFTFYTPPDPKTLCQWKEFLPGEFPIVFKVWDEITVDYFQEVDRERSPARIAGSPNPHFLDAHFFEDTFLAPFITSGFLPHVGCLLFEFRSSTARKPDRFIKSLESFLQKLPQGIPYAIEIREPNLLIPAYFSLLDSRKIAHVLNHWDRMPGIAEQIQKGGMTGDHLVARILTPRGMPYAQARKKFAPYNRIEAKDILPEMRRDVVELCLEAIKKTLPAYVLVNNRSEGCAPLTVKALEKSLRERLQSNEPGTPGQT
jgi:uncharacterized protein YecE (DUF72 family)